MTLFRFALGAFAAAVVLLVIALTEGAWRTAVFASVALLGAALLLVVLLGEGRGEGRRS